MWFKIATPIERGSPTCDSRLKVCPMPGPSNVIDARPRPRNASDHQWSSSLTAFVPLNITTTGTGPVAPRGTRR